MWNKTLKLFHTNYIWHVTTALEWKSEGVMDDDSGDDESEEDWLSSVE